MDIFKMIEFAGRARDISRMDKGDERCSLFLSLFEEIQQYIKSDRCSRPLEQAAKLYMKPAFLYVPSRDTRHEIMHSDCFSEDFETTGMLILAGHESQYPGELPFSDNVGFTDRVARDEIDPGLDRYWDSRDKEVVNKKDILIEFP